MTHPLIEHLQQVKSLRFVDFMQQALYHPNWGYYSGSLTKIGHGGDFITAPELTPLFARTLAKQCLEVLSSLHEPCLFEFGAGSGRLCVDLLTSLEQEGCLPKHYYILELSANLKARQQALVNSQIPHLADRVIWLDRWPEQGFRGIILANEVLDAMPVHRFLWSEEGLLESYISLNESNQLQEQFQPATTQALADYLQPLLPNLPRPYASEVNLFVHDWIAQCAAMLEQGLILLIDYGFPRHEYYHPDRREGTLMCHHQQTTHPDPLFRPGEQDITAHVDFTQVAEAAVDASLRVAGYTSQAAFLLACGLLNLIAEIKDEKAHLAAAQAAKLLLQPSEMGELFKVIALTKNYDQDLSGFQILDKRASL